jgi:hypothetical protein
MITSPTINTAFAVVFDCFATWVSTIAI